MSSETFNVSPEDLADAVAERIAQGFLKLPSEIVHNLKPWAGYKSRCCITGSAVSLQAEIIIGDDGGFTFTLLDCMGQPVTVEHRFHP